MTREGCEKAIRQSVHSRSTEQSIRVGNWNIRRFPHNSANDSKAPTNTDVDWVACAITWLDADVMALEEIQTDPDGSRGQQRLLEALKRFSKRDYALALDECPNRDISHVGILYDKSRLRVERSKPLNELLVGEKECSDNVHPGVTALITDRSGLKFLFVALHLAAHDDTKNFERRQKQFEALKRAVETTRNKELPLPVIATGDFNTIGCAECDDKTDPKDEIKKWSSAFASARVPSELISPQEQCSAYRGTEPMLFDHFLVTKDVPVVQSPDGHRAEAQGICRITKCEKIDHKTMPAYEQRLSDHCPILMTLSIAKT